MAWNKTKYEIATPPSGKKVLVDGLEFGHLGIQAHLSLGFLDEPAVIFNVSHPRTGYCAAQFSRLEEATEFVRNLGADSDWLFDDISKIPHGLGAKVAKTRTEIEERREEKETADA